MTNSPTLKAKQPWALPSNPPFTILIWPDSGHFPIMFHIPGQSFDKIVLNFTKPFSITNLVGYNNQGINEYNTSMNGNNSQKITITFPNLEFGMDDGIWIYFAPDSINAPLLTAITLSSRLNVSWVYNYTENEIKNLNDTYFSPLYSSTKNPS